MLENNKYIDTKEMDKLLRLLKTAKDEVSIESYIYIKNIINSIEFSIPFVLYPKGSKFVRSRIHKNDEVFFEKVSDLSYIKDSQNIKTFGRANEPGQSVFYCADDDWLSFVEISQITSEKKEKDFEYITNGVWISTEDILVVSLLTNDNIRGKNNEIDDLSKSFEEFFNSQTDESSKAFKNLFQFLSKEFSQVAEGNSNHYKITAAFTNYIFDSVKNADGILYPSTLYPSKGFNFAFKPQVVDKKMEFYVAVKRKMEKTGNKKYDQTEYAESLISRYNTNEIIWI